MEARMDRQRWLAERFETHRSHLQGVAYRMLGSDIYITENGCSATDVPAADSIVYDTDRNITC